MKLVVALRVDIPDNPEAETSLRWFLMRWLARADLARAIAQLLPPGLGCEVSVVGTVGEKEDRCKNIDFGRNARRGKSPHWWVS